VGPRHSAKRPSCESFCIWKFRIHATCTLSKVTAGAALSVGILRLILRLNLGLFRSVTCTPRDMAHVPFHALWMRSTRDATHAARTRELNKPFATYGAFVSIRGFDFNP
jgi:hypothetical protein